MPQPVFLLLAQVHIGLEDGEIVFHGMAAEPFLPFLHLLAVPADDATVVDRQCRVGDDQFFVDADDASEALAFGTGAYGRVEGEHVVVGLFEGHTVGLVLHREVVADVRRRKEQPAGAVALIEGGLGGVHQSGDGVF